MYAQFGRSVVILLIGLILLTSCLAHRQWESPWEPLPTLPAAAQPLLGEWKQVATDEQGSTPQPNMLRTLTFEEGGIARMGMWEHELTWQFGLPDDHHVRMTWIASTNPNDKVGEIWEFEFAVNGNELIFWHNGKIMYMFKRVG